MNQKMKATKNNILKKAYMSVAMAIFAGGLFLTTNDSFLPSNMTTTFAKTSKYRRRGLFSRRNRDSYFDEDRLNKYDDFQKSNYQNVCDSWDLILSEIKDSLDLKYLVDEVPAFKNNSDVLRKNAVVNMFKKISSSKEFGALKSAIDDFGSSRKYGRRDDSVVSAANKVIKYLLDVQKSFSKALIHFDTILHMPRTKNPEKLNKIQKMLENKDESLSELIRGVDLIKILDSSKNTDEARRLTNEALKNFFSGEVFNKSSKRDDIWAKVMDLSANDGISSNMYGYASTLQAILYCNKVINDIFKLIATLRITRNYVECLTEIIYNSNVDNDDIRTNILNKNKFFQLMFDRGHGDIVMLPLIFANVNSSDGGVFTSDALSRTSAGRIANISSQCSDKIVDALEGRRDVRKASRALKEVVDRQAGDLGDLLREGYNINNAFNSVLPDDVTFEFFKNLDDLRCNLIGQILPGEKVISNGVVVSKSVTDYYADIYEKWYARTGGNMNLPRSDEEDNAIEFINASTYVNNRSQDNGRYFFVNSNNQLNNTIVSITNAGNSSNAELLKFLLATPATIRSRAIMECYMSDLERSRSHNFSLDSRAFISATNYSSALDSALSDFSNLFKFYDDVLKDIGKIKSEKTDRKKVDSDNLKVAEYTTCLPLNDGNTVRGSVSIENLSDGALRIADPAFANLQEVNMTVVPQDGEKTTKNHRPFAGVKVVNGKVDITNEHLKDIKGSCEIHFRTVDPTNGTDKFLFKLFVTPYDSKLAHQVVYEANTEICSSTHIKNGEKLKVYGNGENSVTLEVPGDKDGVGIMMGVMIEKGNAPDLEHNQFAFHYDAARNVWSANVYGLKANGIYEFHAYTEFLDAKNYQGKIVADTSKSKKYYKSNESSIADYATKEELRNVESSNIQTVDRYYRFVVPKKAFADDIFSSQLVTVGFWDSDNKHAYNVNQNVKMQLIDRTSDDSYWGGTGYSTYSVLLKVPKAFENSTLVITDGFKPAGDVSFDHLRATSNISDKTADNSEIRFEMVNEDGGRYSVSSIGF